MIFVSILICQLRHVHDSGTLRHSFLHHLLACGGLAHIVWGSLLCGRLWPGRPGFMGRPMGHTVRVGSSAPMNRDSMMRRHGTVSVVQRHKSFGQPQGGVGIAFEDRVGTCLLVK